MKTIFEIGVVIILLALDWAALHDISKGEPNLNAEYAMLGFSIIVFGFIIFVRLKKVIFLREKNT